MQFRKTPIIDVPVFCKQTPSQKDTTSLGLHLCHIKLLFYTNTHFLLCPLVKLFALETGHHNRQRKVTQQKNAPFLLSPARYSQSGHVESKTPAITTTTTMLSQIHSILKTAGTNIKFITPSPTPARSPSSRAHTTSPLKRNHTP